jgi:hypothetical protein
VRRGEREGEKGRKEMGRKGDGEKRRKCSVSVFSKAVPLIGMDNLKLGT